jgi:hypothetical protein
MAATIGRSGVFGFSLAGECEAVSADLNLIAVGERQGIYGNPVDVRAIEAAGVDDAVPVAEPTKFGVPVADGDVVEKHCAVRVAAGDTD